MKVGDLVRHHGTVGCFGIITHFAWRHRADRRQRRQCPYIMWRLENGRMNGQYILRTETLEVISENSA